MGIWKMKILIKIQLTLFILLTIFYLFTTFVLAEGTITAGTEIENIATANFLSEGDPLFASSNKVLAIIENVCNINITPNGSVSSPAAAQTVAAKSTVNFVYSLTNTGNATNDIDLLVVIEDASDFTPTNIAISADTDGDGNFETFLGGAGVLSDVPVNTPINLQLTIEIPEFEQETVIYPNLVGKCSSSNAVDDNNVVEIIYNLPREYDLELIKQVNPIEAELGQDVTYTIEIKNHGPDDVFGANVIDILPSELLDVQWTCVADEGSSCSAEGSGRILDDTIHLMVGHRVIYTITARISDEAIAGEVVENTAEVVLPRGAVDTTPDNNSDTATLTPKEPIPETIDELVKQATPPDRSELTVGDELEYIISFSSEEVPLTNVVITDTLSEFLAVPTLSISPEADSLVYDEETRTVTATYASIAARATVELTIATQVIGENIDGEVVINEGATVTWSEGSETSNSTNHPIVDLADISIVKENDLDLVILGGPVTYHIIVTNNGPSDVEGLSVVDEFPALLNEVTWTCLASRGSSCTPEGSGNINDTVNILSGGELIYSVSAILSNDAVVGENLENIASVKLPEGIKDPNPDDNEDNEIDPIDRTGIEELNKSSEPSAGTTLKPGEELSYNISFDIIDSISVSNVRVSDTISKFLELDKVTIQTLVNTEEAAPDVLDYSQDTGELLVVFNVLPAGAHVEVIIIAPVKADAPAEALIRNDGATVEWNNEDSATSPPVVNPVAHVCDLVILPDGTVPNPAAFPNDVISAPSEIISLPYSLQNTGNGTNIYDLSAALEELSDFGSDLSIHIDADADGKPEGEAINEVSIAAGETANLVIVVALPQGGESLSGNAYINLIGQCPEVQGSLNASARDSNNVSRIFIPQGGIEDLDKKLVAECPSNDPTSDLCQTLGEDIKLFPNADVNYQIRFTVGGRQLTNVKVTDLLDVNLASTQPPLQFNDFLITDADGNVLNIEPESSYTTFTPAEAAADPGHSGTIDWIFDSLPAGSEVVISLRSVVKPLKQWIPDIDGNVTIDNNACITFDGVEGDYCVTTDKQGLGEIIGLTIVKVADPTQVTLGEDLNYTIDINNPSQAEVGDSGVVATLEDVELYDPLPKGISYLPSTAKITLPNGNLQDCSELSCEPTVIALDDLVARPIDYLEDTDSEAYQNLARVVPPEFIAAGTSNVKDFLAGIGEEVLFWQLPTLKPGQKVTISFDTDVSPEAVFAEEFTNHATALAFNSQQVAVAVSADSVAVAPELERFANTAVILGTAFVDNDDDGALSSGDSGVAGIRIYLPNGVSVLTDEAGRYTFLDLVSGVTTLKVDPITIPNLRLKPTLNEEAPGFWRLRAYPGVLTRQDIAFEPVYAAVSIDERITVTRGPVTIEKNYVLQDGVILVELLVSSSQALNKLSIAETLPKGTELASLPVYKDTGGDVKANGLTLELGDVLVGFSTTIIYSLITSDQAKPELITPSISWELQ